MGRQFAGAPSKLAKCRQGDRRRRAGQDALQDFSALHGLLSQGLSRLTGKGLSGLSFTHFNLGLPHIRGDEITVFQFPKLVIGSAGRGSEDKPGTIRLLFLVQHGPVLSVTETGLGYPCTGFSMPSSPEAHSPGRVHPPAPLRIESVAVE